MPMPGQGTPLPDFLEVKGEWIIENHLFLYTDGSQNPSAPRLTVGASRRDGLPCIGFDARQLAAALGVDSVFIFAANRDQTLIYLGTASIPPGHGGVAATAYGFRIGERVGQLTVEHYEHEGSA